MERSDSVKETLSNMKIEWTTSDYFIMPDVVLPDYPKDKDIHFGYFALFICVAGDMEMVINDVHTKIEPFCLYAFSPGSIIIPKSQSPDCKLKILTFTKDFLLKNSFKSQDLEDFKFFVNSNFNKISLSQDEVSSLLQLYDLLKEKKDNSQSVYFLEIIRSLFFTFLFEVQAIYSNRYTTTQSSSKRENELKLKFNELIKTHATVQHNLKFYADSLFITPKHLISAIKNAAGKTPGILINETIVEEARQYLVHTNLTISEISDYLQFNDIAAFSKFFKRYTALSPSAFRKKYQL
jgi:AraC-like DNA-binding protein